MLSRNQPHDMMKQVGANLQAGMSAQDIVHYGKVVASLRETIRSLRMGEVDGVIESAGGREFK